jgi:hypothetical protein
MRCDLGQGDGPDKLNMEATIEVYMEKEKSFMAMGP